MLPIIARARTLGLSLALATAGLGVLATVPASADPAATTWDVQVGAGNELDTGLNRFYPSDITIHRGDTVSFAWGGFHTVTFNPPANGSLFDYFGPGGCSLGPLDSPAKFVSGVPFAPFEGVCPPPDFQPPDNTPPSPFNVKIDVPAGTYHFQCMIHQFMHGSIRVKSGALPRTNDENKALRDAQIAADTNRATALDARLTSRASHTSGEAIVGAGDKVVELVKFYPTAITVHVGDELTFTDLDLHEPHTVSFGPIAGNPRDPSFGVFPSGPGNAKAYNGTSPLNSGFLFYQSMYDYWNLKLSPVSSAVPRTHFSVTFTTPTAAGKPVNFYCALHGRLLDDGSVVGMSGHITVLPAQNGGNNG
jgi:plastocyanin